MERYGEENLKQKAIKMMQILHLKMKKLITINLWMKLLIRNVKLRDFSMKRMIQVDIGGHPPFPAGSKQLSSNFGNLLFLAVFHVLNFQSYFEALNEVFLGFF
jgi:hypothetical protein